MILRPKSSPPRHDLLPGAPAAVPMATVPGWLRRAVPDARSLAGKELQDVALAAGAALAVLDQVVRGQEKWAGAWRQRLALGAAAATARQAGRVEDEAALRDAMLLTRPGDLLPPGSTNPGPAGRLLLAWRRLATRPAGDLLTAKNLAAVLEEFGFSAGDDEGVSDLAGELGELGTGAGAVEALTGAFMAVERHGFGDAFGSWLADALVAQRLGWAHAVPLLGAELTAGIGAGRPRRPAIVLAAAGKEKAADRAKNLLAAQAHAALRAVDLSAELGRRAEKLLAVAPKLRARGACTVVDLLLDEDALVASRGDRKTGMSDRALRRLFDRLVELGAVRELSGRPTFRIYGI